MDLHLQGKTALVTAASYGLGYACAEALAKEKVRLAICSRDEGRIALAARDLSKKTGAEVLGFAADLADEEQVDTLITEVKGALGHVDILVLNTGHPPVLPFTEASDEDWQRGLDVVLKPAIQLTTAFVPMMREHRYGRLIYIGSIFGIEPERTSIVQSTFRTGLNAFAKCVATEAAPDGVTANVICPGYFDTPLTRELARQFAARTKTSLEQVLSDWKNIAPAKKFGKPEDLGALAAFLASPVAEYVNGTTITIDGGALKQY